MKNTPIEHYSPLFGWFCGPPRDARIAGPHFAHEDEPLKPVSILWRSFALAIAVVLVAGSGLPNHADAQSRVTVSGSVHDRESGESLPYASIRIEGATGGVAANVDGHFALVGLEPGRYGLIVTYLGYNRVELSIHTDSLGGPLRIELEPKASTLGEVVVTAEQYQIMKAAENVSHITLSPRDLAMLPSIGETDIFRSLQLLPGVSGTNEGSSGLYVRGGTPDQNLVLLDGMTVYHVDHFFGFFSAFNADAIKDVQLYKGGFPAPYGGRVSSVVDLTGKTGGTKTNFGAGVNLLSASTYGELPLGNKASLLISARRSYTDILKTGVYNSIYDTITGAGPDEGAVGLPQGFQGRGGGALGAGSRGAGQLVVQPDFHFYDINSKLSYRPTNKDVLALSVYSGKDNLDESRLSATEVTRGDDVGATVVNDVFDVTGWGNFGASAKWSRQWSPKFYSNTLVAWSEYFSNNDRSVLDERYTAAGDSVLSSRAISSLEDNHLGDISISVDNEWQATRSHKVDFGIQSKWSDVSYVNTRNDSVEVFDEQQSGRIAAGYLQDTWQPVDRLRLTVGGRMSYYDLVDEIYVEPRASVRLDLTSRISLKAAYGTYNQFVTRVVNENVTEGARDFWLLADGDNVGVQSSTHYVGGVSYETAKWLFDVEAYQKDLAGLSEFSLRFTQTGADFEASDLFFDGDGIARGLEFLIQRKIGRYTGWLSYTVAEVKHTFAGLNDGDAFPALHDQPHELKLVASRRFGSRWNASATWAFATGKPYTAPESQYSLTLLDGTEQSFIHVGEKNGERLPAYHRLDASIHYRFPIQTTKADIGFSLFNVYNRTNVWYKEFDLTESPFVTTDVTFLGITPNISFRIDL